MLAAPLEQFQILLLVSKNFFFFNFSVTNLLLVNILALFIYVNFIYFNNSYINKHWLKNNSSILLISNAWQKTTEIVTETCTQLISNTIVIDNEKYVPFISTLFNLILFSNLIGLVPYSFTPTSHLIITFIISFSIFIGIHIYTISKYEMKIFSLFLPSNTTFFLALLLVPIEFISFIAKPISLSVRLFINMMAGHSLLKVIVGFAWSLVLLETPVSIGFVIPIVILIILFGLELGVALIQTYVFIILTCIFIQDGS